MRAGLSTIQQTLTPEAASVLNHSIAEATRRNHGQTTPLHVAATLLASPSGYLRQACIKSHPNSSHPLQCRALELCFSVALERLPTAQNLSPGHDPPISNALMAALKRAQAHQRRGCPEQQQQPLLAVKVELEQLIISILDDPSVSRVMREASFSSPAVKATIEQSLNSSSNSSASAVAAASNPCSFGFGFRTPSSIPVPTPATNRNLYVNPRLQQGSIAQSGQQRSEEVKRLVDILLKNKKRNPVLVGESEPEMVVQELLNRIESKEIGDGLLKNVQVIHLEKEFLDKAQILNKIIELGGLIESRISNSDCGGVIVDLGDLKWLVEQPVNFPGTGGVQQIVSEGGRAAVAEMGKILVRFGERRVWLIGTATCETYLRCHVYHPSMENDWDLQAVPIAPRAPPLPGRFPRIGPNGILSNTVESFSPLKGFPAVTTNPTMLDLAPRKSCCPQCMHNYEKELTNIETQDSDRTPELKSEVAQPLLPHWLIDAKSQDVHSKTLDQTTKKDQESIIKQKSSDLQKKWYDTCRQLHPGYHKSPALPERVAQPSMTGLYNPNLLSRQPFVPKLGLNENLSGISLLNPNLVPSLLGRAITPPQSPVQTELALGHPKSTENTPEKVHEERTKDLLGCVVSEPQTKFTELHVNKLLGALDADSFKRLLKALTEKVWWQREAASAVATTMTQCKLGNGKRQGGGKKGHTWLLFTGPDRVGKKRMALALSDFICGANPIMVSLGSRRDDGEPDTNFRGKTALDRIVEAVRRNPFSVIMLEDIDEADMLVRGSIKRAMERGRISDSHGREISLGNVIFIMTANWLPENLKFASKGVSLDEDKPASLTGVWQLRLSLCEKTGKRRANWLLDEENRPAKPRKDSEGSALSFDLNEAADAEEEKGDGSRNSSDLTVDHEDENALNSRLLTATTSSVPRELLSSVDDNIVFKHVDLRAIQSVISSFIAKRFSTIMTDEEIPFEIQDEALENIAGALWLSKTSLEQFTEQVLVPSIRQLKLRLPTCRDDSMVVRLERHGELQPGSISVVVKGVRE